LRLERFDVKKNQHSAVSSIGENEMTSIDWTLESHPTPKTSTRQAVNVENMSQCTLTTNIQDKDMHRRSAPAL
jgi:hypothetical protein